MNPLYGHDGAATALLDSFRAGRLHHAWLISGPVGIGKALLADKAALRLLAESAGPPFEAQGLDVPKSHPTARLVEAGSHPDLMRLERMPRDDKLRVRPKSEWPDDVELSRSINVDQVRSLQRLFGTTATFSAWRVVVIDSIDDLERPAANALLKNLEEPPPTSLFLLVSHAPERLLPTIRSRCRQLRLGRLDDDAMTSALRAVLPDADQQEIGALATAGEGSPGRAVSFRGLDISGLDRDMHMLAEEGDPTNARRSRLAAALAGKAAQARYEAFLARAPSVIAKAARERQGGGLAEAVRLWERASHLSADAVRLSMDPQGVVFEMAGLLAALAAPRRQQARGA